MDMFFFKEISGLIPEGTELTVTIKRVGNEMIVRGVHCHGSRI